jgi:hypothetical protein
MVAFSLMLLLPPSLKLTRGQTVYFYGNVSRCINGPEPCPWSIEGSTEYRSNRVHLKITLRAAAHQVRQDKHQDTRQKTLSCFIRDLSA